MPAPRSSSSSTRRMRTRPEDSGFSAHHGEQRLDLLAPALVGQRAVGPRWRLERLAERLARSVVVAFAVQEVAEEIVRVDSLGIDLKRLQQELARLLVVTEADRPAGHLVVERAEARVGRSVERARIDFQRLLERLFRVLRKRQRAEAAARSGVACGDDAVPDLRLSAPGMAAANRVGGLGERGERLFLRSRGLPVLDFGPFMLQLLQFVVESGGYRERQGEQQSYENGLHLELPFVGAGACRRMIGSCRRSARSTRPGTSWLRRANRRSGMPSRRSRADPRSSASSSRATAAGSSIATPSSAFSAQTAAPFIAVRVARGAR